MTNRLLAYLDYQCAVNRAVLAANLPRHPGQMGLLAEQELRDMTVAYDAGVPAETFAATLIANRQQVAA